MFDERIEALLRRIEIMELELEDMKEILDLMRRENIDRGADDK